MTLTLRWRFLNGLDLHVLLEATLLRFFIPIYVGIIAMLNIRRSEFYPNLEPKKLIFFGFLGLSVIIFNT
jgi:putative effector of murein hydrolase LrgA (UPF0299 family)